jgi:hypothetical protein
MEEQYFSGIDGKFYEWMYDTAVTQVIFGSNTS